MGQIGVRRTKARVLLADNNPEFLKLQEDEFKKTGFFEVITAREPNEAERLIKTEPLDAVVYDIRLRDDEDDRDISGLELAENTPRNIGKVLISRFPIDTHTGELFKERVGPQSALVSYIDKEEGILAILEEAKKVAAFSLLSRYGLATWNRPQMPLIMPIVLVSLLAALTLGVAAFVTADPRWLFGTIALAAIAVVLVGRSID